MDEAYAVVLRAKATTFVHYADHIRRAGPVRMSPQMQSKLDGIRQYLLRSDEEYSENVNWLCESEELRIWTNACEEHWGSGSSRTANEIGVSAIQQRLDPNGALVDFFFTQNGLTVFLITRDALRSTCISVTQQEIVSKAREVGFLENIGDKPHRDASLKIHTLLENWLGEWFRENLPPARFSQLCLCLHGILHLLPVAAIINNAEPTYGESNPTINWQVPHASLFNSSNGPTGSPKFCYLGILSSYELGSKG